MMGQCRLSIANSGKLLLPNVTVKIVMTRSSADWFFITTADNPAYKFAVDTASMLVRRKQLTSSLMLDHQRLLAADQKAIYSFKRKMLHTAALSPNMLNLNIENQFVGSRQIPSLVVVGLISTDAYNGAYKKNPFNFSLFQLNQASLKIGIKQFPQDDFGIEVTTSQYTRLYYQLFSAIGEANRQSLGNPLISRDSFTAGGYSLLVWLVFSWHLDTPVVTTNYSQTTVKSYRYQ